ncbi:GPI mannosyltransferase 1-like isoform X2 [Pomacea canaliculata]|uniref:GPI mannosyltransferase 1-like isoform X2 n=1 Tax=Pomacea canaliculata TaxID=400727 RepID=UPI000D72F752|nr:GPI mannosyltransferase 1-like isoform X2 [Pomacea canaliculata]
MNKEAVEMRRWYGLGIGVRLAMVVYGLWQDVISVVKFTDIDYSVFSDAATFVTEGHSPYNRTTFRYTPLLAWALTPNVWISRVWGKLLFIAFDALSGHLIYLSLKEACHTHRTAKLAALSWLLNPLPVTVSSRGNAESIMAYLVLLLILFLQRGQLILAGLVYAFAIHIKIYPLTYAPALYLFLGKCSRIGEQNEFADTCSFRRAVTSSLQFLQPTWNHLKFCGSAALTLTILTLVFYTMYGWIFLYETYLYHIVRKDIRHNFSPYFYLLYLTSDHEETSYFIKFLVFLPQLLLLLFIAFRFHGDVPLCTFLCTFSFVMFNKYFLWYLSILPLLLPHLRISWAKGIFATSLWFMAQGLWLLPAYLLEFEGHNTFLYIWIAGLFFYLVNIYIMFLIITHYNLVNHRFLPKTE